MTTAITMTTPHAAALTISDIRRYICPNATESEAFMFLRLCESQGLNPFLREAYLIKYNPNSAATMVVGKDAFTRRAEEHAQFAGFRAGIIVTRNGEIVEREGAFYTQDETLVGGWADVYRHDRKVPFRSTARMEEYNSRQGQWNKMPATMIRKVALVQALREAFPTAFRGLYDAAEMGMDPDTLPTNVIDSTATELPPVPVAPPEPERQRTAVTREQAQEVAALVHTLGWSPAEVAAKLHDLYTAGKLAELSRDQVAGFLDYLRTHAARAGQPQDNGGGQ